MEMFICSIWIDNRERVMITMAHTALFNIFSKLHRLRVGDAYNGTRKVNEMVGTTLRTTLRRRSTEPWKLLSKKLSSSKNNMDTHKRQSVGVTDTY